MEFSTDAARRQEPTRKTTILVGDALKTLSLLPPQSIHCIVTSPPYWGLRDYGVPPSDWPEITYQPMPGLPSVTIPPMVCCLGLEPTPEAFIGHLLHVFRLAGETLRENGTCFVNLGDSYASGEIGRHDFNQGRKCGKATTDDFSVRKQANFTTGLKSKNLVGIPWRFAFAMQADGWYLRSDVIWAKANPMPESVTDRPTRAHEYVFMFAKSERYYADMDAVREDALNTPGGRLTRAMNGNKGKRGDVASRSAQSGNGIDSVGMCESRNIRSVWQSASTPFSAKQIGINDADHYAVMAEPIVEKCVKIGCPKSGTALDPFGGAGTTGLIASRLERNSILCEINPDSARISQIRIEAENPLFYRVEVVR